MRHFIRHTYGFRLDWAQMQELINGIDNIWTVVKEDLNTFREHLKTSVFRCFLTSWRKLHVRNLFYYKKLAIFSEVALKTRLGFLEPPFINNKSQISDFA
jgi:hypothetical protein